MNVSVIGVLSDTHRQLPEGALEIFRGDYSESQIADTLLLGERLTDELPKQRVEEIIHAGDIGELDPPAQPILDSLEQIAPVHAVLGNRDVEGYTVRGNPVTWQMLLLDICGTQIAVAHKPEDLAIELRTSGANPPVRIHGHTHVPKLEQRGEGILLCPGALRNPKGNWPRRTVALVYIEASGKLLGARIVKL